MQYGFWYFCHQSEAVCHHPPSAWVTARLQWPSLPRSVSIKAQTAGRVTKKGAGCDLQVTSWSVLGAPVTGYVRKARLHTWILNENKQQWHQGKAAAFALSVMFVFLSGLRSTITMKVSTLPVGSLHSNAGFWREHMSTSAWGFPPESPRNPDIYYWP